MDRAEYARIAAAEDTHWWYRSMRALMDMLLPSAIGRSARILDAGCGPGGNGSWLVDRGSVFGVDIAEEAVALAHQRHGASICVVRGDVQRLPIAGASIDLAVGVTILNSVPEDRRAVVELARILRPGGVLLVVEPAFRILRRDHDAVVHSARRYRRPQLEAVLDGAGFEVERATYAYSFLLPAAVVLAVAGRVRSARGRAFGRPPRSDVERGGPTRLLGLLAAAERALLRRWDLPIGLSVVVLARRAA